MPTNQQPPAIPRPFRDAALRAALGVAAFVVGLGALAWALGAPPVASGWLPLAPGLELAEIPSLRSGVTADSRIRVLRIDPARFELRLLMSSASPDRPRLTAREWRLKHNLVATINAGMYQQDLSTSVSLMKTRKHTNNPRLTKHRSVLAFDRLDDSVPPVQIIDLDAQKYEDLAPHYGSLLQSIRMVALDGRNVWAPQPRKYSVAAVAMDREGRVLLIHSRAPHTPHDLVETLREAPINLRNAMYLEGGPIAQLSIGAGGRELELTGAYGELVSDDDPAAAQPIPNVLGVAPRR